MRTPRAVKVMMVALSLCSGVAVARAQQSAFEVKAQPSETRFEIGSDELELGYVVVRSTGAYLVGTDWGYRTVIVVSVTVVNDSSLSMATDTASMRLVAVDTSRGRLTELAPFETAGRLDVPPGDVAEGHALFLLPDGLLPQDVMSYQARVTLRHDDGSRHSLTAAFSTFREGSASRPSERAATNAYVNNYVAVYDPYHADYLIYSRWWPVIVIHGHPAPSSRPHHHRHSGRHGIGIHAGGGQHGDGHH